LIQHGVNFKTNSDTEVVVNAFSIYGIECFNMFRGMFSAAIYDKFEKNVILFRDPFGIKPLNYYIHQDYIAFSSEIQSFMKIPNFSDKISFNSIDKFLQFQYIPAPNSVFENIKKILPGSFLIINSKGNIIESKNYFKLEFKIDNSINFNDALNELDVRLNDSVVNHLISDVEIGAFLSGGVDSSLIVNYISNNLNKKFKTFNIGFKNSNFDESNFANLVAHKYKTEHISEIIDVNLIKELPKLIKHFGEPLGDCSILPTYYVSKLAGKYVPVVLSGDGGDEFFAGYSTHINWIRKLTGITNHFDNLNFLYKFIYRFFQLMGIDKYKFKIKLPNPELYLEIIQYIDFNTRINLWKDNYKKKILNKNEEYLDYFNKFNQKYPVNTAQGVDLKLYLPNDILFKLDVSSMINSVESRTPIIDLKVWELAKSVNPEFNLKRNKNGYVGKYLLKRLALKYFDKKFVFRKKAGFTIPVIDWLGFTIPVIDWLYTDYGNKPYINILKNKDCLIYELFEYNKIQSYIKNKNPKVWLIFYLEFWFQEHKDFLNYD